MYYIHSSKLFEIKNKCMNTHTKFASRIHDNYNKIDGLASLKAAMENEYLFF